MPAWVSAAEPPRVLVSMAPIHSLVAGVMRGISTPELLVKGGISPHNTRLKPSQMRLLSQADLIIWLGEEAEGFLRRPLENRSKNQQTLKILALPKLLLLPLRKGGIWEKEHHNTQDAHGHATAQQPEHIDSHVWLDPLNAKIIAQAVADTLSKMDTEHASQYQENAQRLIFRLENLHLEISAVVATAINKPHIVFHDAYQYFEHRYHLTPAGSVTLDPGRKPGARRLREIQQKLQETNAHCIFSEPQFPSSHLKILAGDGQYYSGTLDPIGSSIPPGPDMYFILMRRLVSDFVSCLCQIYAGDEFEEKSPVTE
ncbi:MAG: zinc ABC transporter substrate-binding protein [Candidatus Polarisedimenticolaceae bacterium]|nr:zinc ABC transporter substrate-binding protein [Candidatus Polarisedimenticolaceae bacterium]